jgi:hypothetical protein
MTRLIAPALLALLLTACGGDEAKKAEGAGTAQGEVLPGSVSDAMIPLDQVKSQAPLAPKVEGADKKDVKAPDKAKSAAPAKPADEPAPAEAEPAAED